MLYIAESEEKLKDMLEELNKEGKSDGMKQNFKEKHQDHVPWVEQE